jgi:hypothetical protein
MGFEDEAEQSIRPDPDIAALNRHPLEVDHKLAA